MVLLDYVISKSHCFVSFCYLAERETTRPYQVIESDNKNLTVAIYVVGFVAAFAIIGIVVLLCTRQRDSVKSEKDKDNDSCK